MAEPRRSTRARAREEAAPATPETTSEKPAKGPKSTLKRKRTSVAVAVKDPEPGTPVAEAAQQQQQPPSKPVLPLRITDGQPLPTLPEPQPLELPSTEWQNIQQSGVLSASLQRSRAVWVSGVNFRTFHKKYTMPKKVSERTDADKQAKARQKEIEKNFPQVGTMDAQLVIEPHTFPIKLYAPKEGSRAAPKKMAPPQQYGAWPNHGQHGQHSQHPPQYQPYGQAPYPPKPPPPQSQSRPPPPKPIQHASPQTAPGPASIPAPDPVIHMLAARAGTDPELKAVMKIVAAGQAGKEQLEFFQKHINELTEILEKQKKSKAAMPMPMPVPGPVPHIPAASPAPSKQQAPSSAPLKQQAQSPAPPKQAPSPAPSKEQVPTPAAARGQIPSPAPSSQPDPSPAPAKQQTPAPTSAKQSSVPAASPAPAQPKQHPPTPTPPPPRPAMPPQQQPPAPPKVFNSAPPPLQQHRPPPPQARPPPPNTYQVKNYNQPPYYQQPPPHYAPQQPPRITYRPLTFEFVEGNGDRFYFPSYSFMEWLPNGSGAKFSFLVTKLKPKPEDAAAAAAKPPSTPATPAPPQTPTPAGAVASAPAGAPAPTSSTTATGQPNNTPAPFPPPPATPATPSTPTYTPPPRIEDFDDRADIPAIALYQPVTVLVLTDEHDVKSALPRAIRPPSEVHKYMEDVFDACDRARETYLAFRLPREGAEGQVAAEGEGATPLGTGTGTPGVDEGRLEGEREKRRKSGPAAKRKSVAAAVAV
ncbi:hypothetical protein B5807_12163 [Epicoccum nigrum]|uniref:SWR1-complex protein 3 domain-containing protein n=1 Tax=Epicoccum nigrum TaxID=105696 RepID=A0A1Y2LHY0_EPING|nr:hypothetical protein B5807_12163 [Epicoccum nigrum]